MKELTASCDFTVRFSEVDSMGVVWHGHYVAYLEEGRKAFGKKYNIDYMDIYKKGYLAPIVEMECKYKSSLTYNDQVEVKIKYIDTPAMKICFSYDIYNKATNKLALSATTTQVLLDKDGNLVLCTPDFIEEWKKQYNLL